MVLDHIVGTMQKMWGQGVRQHVTFSDSEKARIIARETE